MKNEEVREKDSLGSADPEQRAKELFFDFIWEFYNDSAFQVSRIDFPLLLGDSAININDWIFDRFFNELEYTFYFMKEVDFTFRYSKDYGDWTSLSWIYPGDSLILNYKFIRENSDWKLKEIGSYQISKDYANGIVFLISNFYKDSTYHKAHIRFPLEIDTWIDTKEEDFKDTTFLVAREDWHFVEFYPGLNRFPVISFNSEPYEEIGSRFILFVGGNDNGIHMNYFFEKIDDEWYLTKLDDSSN